MAGKRRAPAQQILAAKLTNVLQKPLAFRIAAQPLLIALDALFARPVMADYERVRPF